MMYLIYDLATGTIVSFSTSEPQVIETQGYMETPTMPDARSCVVEGVIRPRKTLDFNRPPSDAMISVNGSEPRWATDWMAPTEAGVYNIVAVGKYYGEKSFVVEDLDAAKTKKIAEIEEARDRRLAVGAPTPWGVFQADQNSRTNLNGAVQMAVIGGANFTMNWRRADDAMVTLNAMSMIQVGVMVGKFVNEVYAWSFDLKEAVKKSPTVEAVRAIAIVEINVG
jgi:hypothetical protein